MDMNQPASAYFMEERHDPNETHTLSVLVANEPVVLARVIGLFSGRGYNIESLTVSDTEAQKHVSRITIVTTGTPMVIQQIKHQLDRMIPVYQVVDMTLSGRSIERELAMVKVKGSGDQRIEAMFANGFLEEVKSLLAKGYSPSLPTMSAIGYRECIKVIKGELNEEQAKAEIRRATRIFVRRQANWFKESDPNIKWFRVEDRVIEKIESNIRARIALRED